MTRSTYWAWRRLELDAGGFWNLLLARGQGAGAGAVRVVVGNFISGRTCADEGTAQGTKFLPGSRREKKDVLR
jgi:hypothetical protein